VDIESKDKTSYLFPVGSSSEDNAGAEQAVRDDTGKTYRTKVLDCYVFDSLQEVRDMTADWLHRYNH